MKLQYILLLLLFIAGGNGHAIDYKKSVGLGFQYGGLGGQVSTITALGKSRVSLGFIAITVGHEFMLGDKVTLGLQAFKFIAIQESVGRGISMNYYFNAVDRDGWHVGLESSWYKDDLLGFRGSETINRTFLSVGYTF